MAREVGIGVVSLGWMGRLHTSSYQRLATRFPELAIKPRLVVAADPLIENQQAAVEQYGFEKAVSSIDEVLADPDVEVVSICSPNFLHRDFALKAAAAGKPFWIEKPMGVSDEESVEIYRAASEAGIATAVGFNYRHAPAVEHLKALVASGRLGRITNVRNWLIADYASSEDGPLTWRYSTERAGAGVLGDLLSHGIDLVSYVTGQQFSSVTAMTEIFIPERPIPTKMGVGHGGYEIGDEVGAVENQDYVAALARLDGGAVATLESSRVARGDRSDYAIEVFGTEGSARWSFFRMNEFEVQIGDGGLEHGYTTVLASGGHGDYERFQPGPGIPMSFDDLKTIEAKQFLSDAVLGTTEAPSARDGFRAATVVEAMVRSAASGRWEDVPVVD
ncbi:Gfo/Idh/MocA family protein [Helcobacillus massiliensis]|nr:Gfo/Idh/MocA family oxidoreductase [Helcobacillus massiliensis]